MKMHIHISQGFCVSVDDLTVTDGFPERLSYFFKSVLSLQNKARSQSDG